MKMWMIVRHGTRNPSKIDIFSMKERLSEIRNIILRSSALPNGMSFYFTNVLVINNVNLLHLY